MVCFDRETGRQTGEAVLQHEDDGSPFACGARAFVSAVIVNESAWRLDDLDEVDQFIQERPMRARVIHHPCAQTPLPLTVFAVDEQIVFRDGRWVELPRTGVRREE